VKTGEKNTGTIAFRFRQVLLYLLYFYPHKSQSGKLYNGRNVVGFIHKYLLWTLFFFFAGGQNVIFTFQVIYVAFLAHN
jgi:hypothetical protein